METTRTLKKFYKNHVSPKIPEAWQATALLRTVGFLKIPLLFSVRPTVLQLNKKKSEVKIPLRRWTKNHLGSMYFGALAIGADAVVGILALYHIEEQAGENVSLVFKDFQAEFLKRPTDDVHFICEDGENISKFVKEMLASGERMNLRVPAIAIVPKKNNEVVAKFQLTLSLKKK